MELILKHELESQIALKTLKRKIQDDDATDVIQIVTRDYCKKYRTCINPKDLEWRGFVLYDKGAMQERMHVLSRDCQYIPPRCSRRAKVMRFSHENYPFTSTHLPSLYVDALLSVFAWLKPVELIPLRLVCRDWARIIRNHKAFWRLRENRIMKWPGGVQFADDFALFVSHMFVGASRKKVVEFFFKCPMIFFHIASLSVGNGSSVTAATSYLRYGPYALDRESGALSYSNTIPVEMGVFLNVYRDYIKM